MSEQEKVPHLKTAQHYWNVIVPKWGVDAPSRVRWSDGRGEWKVNNHIHPVFAPELEYELLPETRSINGHEYPEPLAVEPKEGTYAWSPLVVGNYGKRSVIYYGRSQYYWLFENGLLHDNPDAAQAHFDAICKASREE